MIQYQADTIRRIREAKGLTQAELAERLGAKRQWVLKLEAGEHSPTMKTFQRVLRALDVDEFDDLRPFFVSQPACDHANRDV